MADKSTKKEEKIEVQEKIEAPVRIHFNEFTQLHTNLDGVQKAGLRAVSKKEWMELDEWKSCLNDYLGESNKEKK